MWNKRNRQLFGDDIARSEITPRGVREPPSRISAMGAVAATATGLASLNGEAFATMTSPDAKRQLAAKTNPKFVVVNKVARSRRTTTTTSSAPTKAIPCRNAPSGLRPKPWKISVKGAIKNPKAIRHRQNA